MGILTPSTLADQVDRAGSSGDKFPFYRIVPKEFAANLEFRHDLLTRWSGTAAERKQLVRMCARDLLFWVNAFVWTYDPRRMDAGDDPNIPFISYPYQDGAFAELQGAIGRKDKVLRKSRGVGASWICLTTIKHRFNYSTRRESYMFISRTGNLVDNGDDPDTLFWKLDFIDEWSPGWLTPPIKRRAFQRFNQNSKCIIDGAATTGDAGRGGRRTAFFIDEHNAFSTKEGYEVMTATQHNTKCRIVNGTTKGVGTAFHSLTVNPKYEKIEMWWWMHPEWSKGLYWDAHGRRRSPWYDKECDRAVNIRTDVYAELDGDFHAAEYPFYPMELIQSLKDELCFDPFLIGELVYDPDSGVPSEFREEPHGRLKLWCYLSSMGSPVRHSDYVLGADISQGTGATNSTLSVVDATSGEKLAEAGDPFMEPSDWAVYCLAVAYFFGGIESQGCKMIWEANGGGRLFGRRVVEAGYRNIHYRHQEDKLSNSPTDFPGWWADPKSRYSLHSDYRKAIKERRFINRSLRALEDCIPYVHTADSDVVHAGAENTQDPTAARESHGDFCVADALANRAMGRVEPQKLGKKEPLYVPDGCYLARRREYSRALEPLAGRY